jgi:hypothetical protein
MASIVSLMRVSITAFAASSLEKGDGVSAGFSSSFPGDVNGAGAVLAVAPADAAVAPADGLSFTLGLAPLFDCIVSREQAINVIITTDINSNVS